MRTLAILAYCLGLAGLFGPPDASGPPASDPTTSAATTGDPAWKATDPTPLDIVPNAPLGEPCYSEWEETEVREDSSVAGPALAPVLNPPPGPFARSGWALLNLAAPSLAVSLRATVL